MLERLLRLSVVQVALAAVPAAVEAAIPGVGGVTLAALIPGLQAGAQSILEAKHNEKLSRYLEHLEAHFDARWEQTFEWFLESLDRARRVRGEAKLKVLAALTASVLSPAQFGRRRPYAQCLWDLVADLSEEELALLQRLWTQAEFRSRGVDPRGMPLETYPTGPDDDGSLVAAYLVRLQGAGLLETDRIELKPRGDEQVLMGGKYHVTRLTEDLFALLGSVRAQLSPNA